MSEPEKILLDPGILDLNVIKNIIDGKDNLYVISQDILYNGQSRERYSQLHNYFGKKLLPTYPNGCSVKLLNNYWEFSDNIVKSILDDHKTFQLYDRCNRFFFKSSSIKILEIIPKIYNSINWIKKYNPTRIVYMATPHHIDTWIFARVAEELGIKINYFDQSILPWRYFLFEGMNNKRVPIDLKNLINHPDTEKDIKCYLQKKRGNTQTALPPYVKYMRKKNKGKILNFREEIKRYWKKPDIIINKYRCYKKLIQFVKPIDKKDRNYAIFFLHYQPERTTLPEAYGYSQQTRAIMLLRNILPQNIKLYIKEHPSIYSDFCSWRERTPKFYEYLNKIPNTAILPLESSAYDLMDNAKFIATIKGLVAHEAYLRGIPVILFSNLWLPFVDCNYVHHYEHPSKLKNFLNNINNNDKREIMKSAEIYINKIVQLSFAGNKKRPSHLTDAEYSRYQRKEAILNGINNLIKSM